MAAALPEEPGKPSIIPIPLPKGFQRLSSFPIDSTSVFKDPEELESYIQSPVCYPGQIVSHVDESNNTTTVYKINPDKSKTIVGVVGDAADTSVVVLNEDIEILGGAIGSYKEGDIVKQGDTVTSILKKILQRAIPPVYVAPVFTITPSGVMKVEIGSFVTPSITPSFSLNDGGELSGNNYWVEKTVSDIWLKKLEAHSPIEFTDSQIQIVDQWVKYRASLFVPEGAIKNNNLNEPDPTGHFLGEHFYRELHYIAVRSLFYGTSNDLLGELNSNIIRDLDFNKLDPQKGEQVTVNIPQGTREVVFAYPSTLAEIASIRYVELGNAEMKDTFTKIDVEVEGAEGFDVCTYLVYVYRPDVPFGSNATFTFTI